MFEMDMDAIDKITSSVSAKDYDISVKLVPETQQLSAHCKVKLITGRTDTFVILSESLNVSRLEINGKVTSPLRRGPIMTLPTREGESELLFEYAGRIPHGSFNNYVAKDRVELNVNLPWYPLFCFPRRKFSARLQVAERGNLEVISSPTTGSPKSKSKRPLLMDLVIVGGKVRGRAKGRGLSVVSFAHDDSPDEIRKQGEASLRYLTSILGPSPFGEVRVVETLRQEGGGYAREGLVVLQDVKEPEYRKNWHLALTHELAHEWWGIGILPKDEWLSEGLATYWEYRFAKDIQGSPEGRKVLRDRMRRLKGIRGSVARANSWSKGGWELSRFGGLYVLASLENELADLPQLLSSFAAKNMGQAIGSEDFIGFFREHVDEGLLRDLICTERDWNDVYRSLAND